MVLVGLWILVELVSPMTPKRAVLVAAMFGAFAIVMAIPFAREFFRLVIPPVDIIGVILGVSILAAVLIHVGLRLVDHHGGKWVPWLRTPEENEAG
jgi:cation-transporting ATPase E